MSGYQNTAVLGAGVIGMSWAALFLASGRNVAVFDTLAGAEKSTRDYIEMAWPALRDLGLIKSGAPGGSPFTNLPSRLFKRPISSKRTCRSDWNSRRPCSPR